MTQRKKDQYPKIPGPPYAVINPACVPIFEDTPLFKNPSFPDYSSDPWKWPPEFKFEVIETKPLWLAAVERIMRKALDHKNAGREGQFSQVLVPKDDFVALVEYFGEEPWISTCLGIIPVYPVNPDGATFVD